MGTYSPAPVVTDAVSKQTMDEIMWRTARAMVAEGAPFKGTLFAGLMIKDGKVRRNVCPWVCAPLHFIHFTSEAYISALALVSEAYILALALVSAHCAGGAHLPALSPSESKA